MGVVCLPCLLSGTAMDAPASVVETLGDMGQVIVPASAIVAAIGHKDKHGALQLGTAYLTAMGVVLILKPAINHPRPDGGRQSFPSGHAASAFVGAAFLQRRYGWSYGGPAYAAATFVAYSRVHARRHLPSDVIAGGVIGVAANLIFTKRHEKAIVYPVFEPDGVGLAVEVRW